MKKKTYVAVEKVRAFIEKQPEETQVEYLKIVDKLEQDGFLIAPFSKKIENDLYEIRIRRGKNIRVFHFFTMRIILFLVSTGL